MAVQGALVGDYGTHVDNPSVLALLHPLHRFLADQEHALQVGIKDEIPAFLCDFEDIFCSGGTGVVDQDVKTVEMFVQDFEERRSFGGSDI